jgi:hypothetical protein
MSYADQSLYSLAFTPWSTYEALSHLFAIPTLQRLRFAKGGHAQGILGSDRSRVATSWYARSEEVARPDDLIYREDMVTYYRVLHQVAGSGGLVLAV